jgi:hypothetical protein
MGAALKASLETGQFSAHCSESKKYLSTLSSPGGVGTDTRPAASAEPNRVVPIITPKQAEPEAGARPSTPPEPGSGKGSRHNGSASTFRMVCAKHRTKMAAEVLALIERRTREMER